MRCCGCVAGWSRALAPPAGPTAILLHQMTRTACAASRWPAVVLSRITCCCYVAVVDVLAHRTLRFTARVNGHHSRRDRLCASVGAVCGLTVTKAALTRLRPCQLDNVAFLQLLILEQRAGLRSQ